MKTVSLTLLCILGLGGCQQYDLTVERTDAGVRGVDGHCPAPADMTAVASCAAAAGLAGTVLENLCIDFSTISDQMLGSQPLPQQLTNWSFNNPPNCWEIASGKLQIVNFSMFATTCAFSMPALSASDYNKYNSFTLSVVQTLDLNPAQQKAQIMMGQADPLMRLVDWATGTQPRQKRVYEIAKTALPNGGTNAFQPLFQIQSGMGSSANAGWLIESVAVLGNM